MYFSRLFYWGYTFSVFQSYLPCIRPIYIKGILAANADSSRYTVKICKPR